MKSLLLLLFALGSLNTFADEISPSIWNAIWTYKDANPYKGKTTVYFDSKEQSILITQTCGAVGYQESKFVEIDANQFKVAETERKNICAEASIFAFAGDILKTEAKLNADGTRSLHLTVEHGNGFKQEFDLTAPASKK